MPICVLREQLADYDLSRTGFYAHFDANAAEFRNAGVTLRRSIATRMTPAQS